jgi:DNA-directed RNA polymerase specialized sigma24 family protein
MHVDTSAEISADAFARRYASAYRVVYRLLGDAVAADVLARDAIVQVGAEWRKRHPASVDARVCCRAAKLALSDEIWFGRLRSPASGTGFGEIPHRDERRRLRMAVRVLGGRARTVFILEHLAGWAPDDVAHALRLSPEACSRRSARALAEVSQRTKVGPGAVTVGAA